MQRITLVNDVLILSGAGVGGGSLVYANTLYEPLDAFYTNPQWGHITDWRAELAPFYDQAKQIAGRGRKPGGSPRPTMRCAWSPRSWASARRSARRPVSVSFGEPGKEVDDPYFGGAGPEPNRLRAMRRVHDRLPAQREEPAGPHLPASG